MSRVKTYYEKAVAVLTDPKKFFSSLKRGTGMQDSIEYFTVLSSFNLIISAIAVSVYQQQAPGIIFLVSFVVTLLFLIVASIIWSAVLSLVFKLFKGAGNFFDTYQIVVYSSTPALLLNLVPYLRIVGSFYSLYLLFVGAQIVHKLTPKKLAIIYLGFLLLLVIRYLFLYGVFSANLNL